MSFVRVLWIATPFLALALGLWSYSRHSDIDWQTYGYAGTLFYFLTYFLTRRLSAENLWAGRLRTVGLFAQGVGVALVLAALVQAVAANPADWFDICLKNWAAALMAAFIVMICIVGPFLGPLTPASLRSGRKVPLTPFLDRK